MNQPKTGSSNEYDQTTPRLFRLRDLHPPKTVASPPVEASGSIQQDPASLSTVTASNAVEPYRAQLTAAHQSPSIAESEVHASADHQDAAVCVIEEDSTEQMRTRERIERHLDVSPDGRSWMESALAHRKVLVLLLVAIGAAFWTSRGVQDGSSSDQEFAEAHGTLEFDPTQFDAGTLVDERLDWGPMETSSDTKSQDMIASANNPAVNSRATHVTPDQQTNPMTNHAVESVTADANQNSRLASNSLIPTRSNDTAISVGPTVASLHSGTVATMATPRSETSTTHIQAGGLAVHAVSSKTPRDPEFNAPSLEDLERAAVTAASVVPTRPGTELILQNSDTPNGVTDWLKYLPSQP